MKNEPAKSPEKYSDYIKLGLFYSVIFNAVAVIIAILIAKYLAMSSNQRIVAIFAAYFLLPIIMSFIFALKKYSRKQAIMICAFYSFVTVLIFGIMIIWGMSFSSGLNLVSPRILLYLLLALIGSIVPAVFLAIPLTLEVLFFKHLFRQFIDSKKENFISEI